jgi:pentapeptide MXKDX repeat protein
MKRFLYPIFVAAGFFCAAQQVHADDAASPPKLTKHQMMKDCMAKQKASDGGIPKEQMRKSCRDVTGTEKENENTERAADRSREAPST